MSDPDDGNKTVFRPSPLAARKTGGTTPPGHTGRTAPPSGGWPGQGAPAAAPAPAPLPPGGLAGAAAPALSLATAMRSGDSGTTLPQLHAQAAQAIGLFDKAIAAYPEAVRQRATYVVSATIDDVAQHVAGAGDDGAEWARRSMVAQFSGADIDEDRFGQIVDEAVRGPTRNRDLIDLLQACLAAGFEGSSRGAPAALQTLAGKLKDPPPPAAEPDPPAAAASAPPPPATRTLVTQTRPAPIAPVPPPPPPVWTPGNKPAAAAPPGAAPAAPAPAPARRKRGRGWLIAIVVVVLLVAAAFVAARLLLPRGSLSIGTLKLSQVDRGPPPPTWADSRPTVVG